MEEPDKGYVGGESSWNRCIKDLVEEVQFLLCDSRGKEVLVTQINSRDMLPGWFSENAFHQSMVRMKQAATDIFGPQSSFTVLRCIWKDTCDVTRDRIEYELERSIVVLECQHGLKDIPKNFQWVNVDDASIYHSEEEARFAIREELGFIKNHVCPDFRVPWGQVGWYKRITMWMCDQLSARGFVVTQPTVQLRTSPWGIVLQTGTKSKKFYLKASPRFCNEAAITDILSSVAPLQVQKPLILDVDARIFVANDHGESVNSIEKLSNDDKIQLFTDLAQVQKASILKVKELQNAGLPRYETGWIAENLDGLLESEELSFMKEDDAIKELRNLKEDIRNLLFKLERLSDGLPMTLVHGDFSSLSDNVYRAKHGSRGFGFFDWDCAYVGLPLFDMCSWEGENALVDPYLKEWSGFHREEKDSVKVLREALSLAYKIQDLFGCFRLVYDLGHMEEKSKATLRSYVRLKLSAAAIAIAAR